MNSTGTELTVLTGILAGLVVAVVLMMLFRKSSQVDLTRSSGAKPAWMRETPPAETVAATQAEASGTQVFHHAPGERLAAPFAEQIEDIVRVHLAERADLSGYQVDFGTAPDGGLEIHVNGETFTNLEAIPHEGLKSALRQAIQEWQQER